MIEKTEQEIMENWKGDKNKPFVSVCTITYKHEKYIAEALDSFLMQETDFPFEIVVDDDCSPDHTAEVIKTYAEKFPNIVNAHLREKNVGVTTNFKENMQRAKGKYIALCEGDDYWSDLNKLQFQINIMEKHPDCDMSFHPSKIVYGTTETDVIMAEHSVDMKIYTISEVIKGSGSFCPTASTIYKKSVLDKIPDWFNDSPVGDYFLQIFGSFNGGALYINKIMSIYRQGVDGAWSSSMKSLDVQEQFFRRMVSSLDNLDIFLDRKYHNEIYGMKIHRYQTMAMLYLDHKFFKEFQQLMNELMAIAEYQIGMEYKLYYKMKEKPKLLYLLRQYPWILSALKSIYIHVRYQK